MPADGISTPPTSPRNSPSRFRDSLARAAPTRSTSPSVTSTRSTSQRHMPPCPAASARARGRGIHRPWRSSPRQPTGQRPPEDSTTRCRPPNPSRTCSPSRRRQPAHPMIPICTHCPTTCPNRSSHSPTRSLGPGRTRLPKPRRSRPGCGTPGDSTTPRRHHRAPATTCSRISSPTPTRDTASTSPPPWPSWHASRGFPLECRWGSYPAHRTGHSGWSRHHRCTPGQSCTSRTMGGCASNPLLQWPNLPPGRWRIPNVPPPRPLHRAPRRTGHPRPRPRPRPRPPLLPPRTPRATTAITAVACHGP